MIINPQNLFRYDRLQEPLLRFFLNKKFANPRIGLRRAGPYDAERHRDEEINVGVIAERSMIPNLKRFVQHLIEGFNYYLGFRKTFKVKNISLGEDDIKEISYITSFNDISSIENAYFELADRLPDRSVIIIGLNDELIERNYANIKALKFRYIRKTIRLQLIRRSTLEKALMDPTALEFTLFNMGTATYAKMGGIPWVLDQQLIPAGIFVGIAFTKPKIKRSNNRRKELFYYGILAVYNKFGKYIDMNARAITVETDKYLSTKGLYIPKSDMTAMINQIISEYRPPVLVVHKSARFHKDEIEAIGHVLDDKEIRYSLIHVEASNLYRGYGEEEHDGTAVRGDLILDNEFKNRAILFTTGCIQGKQKILRRSKPGTPRPIELEIEENTTSFSPKDFAEHVLGLTKLDWNTTDLEVRMPITLKYARRIAMLIPYLISSGRLVTDVRDLM